MFFKVFVTVHSKVSSFRTRSMKIIKITTVITVVIVKVMQ